MTVNFWCAMILTEVSLSDNSKVFLCASEMRIIGKQLRQHRELPFPLSTEDDIRNRRRHNHQSRTTVSSRRWYQNLTLNYLIFSCVALTRSPKIKEKRFDWESYQPNLHSQANEERWSEKRMTVKHGMVFFGNQKSTTLLRTAFCKKVLYWCDTLVIGLKIVKWL